MFIYVIYRIDNNYKKFNKTNSKNLNELDKNDYLLDKFNLKTLYFKL